MRSGQRRIWWFCSVFCSDFVFFRLICFDLFCFSPFSCVFFLFRFFGELEERTDARE